MLSIADFRRIIELELLGDVGAGAILDSNTGRIRPGR